MSPRVVFIGGSGRCGSTLLELMLGEIEGFHAGGEIRQVWGRGFVGNELCGCRRPFRLCPYWTAVSEEAFGGFQGVDGRRVQGLRRSVDRMWLVPRLIRRAPGRAFRRRVDRYVEPLGRLVRAMASVSGAHTIVDSSKAASHALLLRAIPGLEVVVVHLVRDSRGVAHSWRRRRQRPEIHWEVREMPRQSVVRSAVEWDAMNLSVEMTRAAGLPYHRIRYEDLVAAPAETLGTLLSALSVDRGPALDGAGRMPIGESHTVSGNPARFATDRLEIRPDLEWERAMGLPSRALVSALTWPVMARYGYGSKGSRRGGRVELRG
jgi:hypothetical protein